MIHAVLWKRLTVSKLLFYNSVGKFEISKNVFLEDKTFPQLLITISKAWIFNSFCNVFEYNKYNTKISFIMA